MTAFQPAKFRAFWKNDIVACFIVALLWQLCLLFLGFLIDRHEHHNATLIGHTVRWDSNWYQAVIHDWYRTNLPSAAFYPLYPLTIWTTSLFGLFDLATSAFIVNIICLWLIGIALVRITHLLIGEKYRYLPFFFLLVSPAAIFMHFFYTEALFLAIGSWAYLFALQKKWLFMSILLIGAVACRLPGILFFGLCFLEFCRIHNWDIRSILHKNVLYFLLPPLGFIGYGIYLYWTQRDFLGMFHAYTHTTDWIYQKFNPDIFETLLRAAYQILRYFLGLRPFDYDLFINHLLPLSALGLLILSSLYFIFTAKKKFIPLGISGLIATILFTLNSNVVSVHRYVLPMFGIYLFLTLLWIQYSKLRYGIVVGCIASVILQLYLFDRFISNVFIG